MSSRSRSYGGKNIESLAAELTGRKVPGNTRWVREPMTFPYGNIEDLERMGQRYQTGSPYDELDPNELVLVGHTHIIGLVGSEVTPEAYDPVQASILIAQLGEIQQMLVESPELVRDAKLRELVAELHAQASLRFDIVNLLDPCFEITVNDLFVTVFSA